MTRPTRRQIEREFLHHVVDMIMQYGGDPWPDHLWPQASEVCLKVCKRLAEEWNDRSLLDAIENAACEESGMLLWEIHEGKSPLHKAYQSLFDLYNELEEENQRLRHQLGVEPDYLLDELREKIYGPE